MGDVQMVPVMQDRLDRLEQEHAFLEQIRECSRLADSAEEEYQYAKNESLEKKKAWDRCVADLQRLIKEGPAKPDPQGRLPFADEAEDVAAVSGGAVEEVAVVAVPVEIDGLDLTDKQKQSLASAGAKGLADLVDIANGNWPQYPNGLASIGGFGPKAIEKLAKQLPSTAPVVDDAGRPPSSTAKIEVLSMASGADGIPIEVGDEFDATIDDQGVAVVQLPGYDPYPFSPGEYRVVS